MYNDPAANPQTVIPRPGLTIVATPIGNLRDITLRALDALRAADVILCEDTRVTGRLLTHYGIRTPMQRYDDHTGEAMRPKVMAMLAEGRAVALVSDAGTPLISDPGYKLVRSVSEAGFAVTTLPGPSAPMAALTLAGLPTDRFLFTGFLPAKAGKRRQTLAELASVAATLVVMESPYRLLAGLEDMLAVLGDREAAVVREISKRFEEVRRNRLTALCAHYRAAGDPKGEIIVVIAPPEGAAAAAASDEQVREALGEALRALHTKEAVKQVAEQYRLPRKEVYALALSLKEGAEHAP